MKAANETDLGKVRAEVTKAARTMHSAMQALRYDQRVFSVHNAFCYASSLARPACILNAQCILLCKLIGKTRAYFVCTMHSAMQALR